MFPYSCRFCHKDRNIESYSNISEAEKQIYVEYYCGTQLRITITGKGNKHEWIQKCLKSNSDWNQKKRKKK